LLAVAVSQQAARAERRPVFISWSVRHGRSRDLAAALGADAVYIGVRRRRRRWLSPLRYVWCAAQTIALLARRRPKAVFVMAPPLPLAALAIVYGRVARASICIDAHTGAVRAMRSGRERALFVAVARLADVVIVTNSELAEPLRRRGVRAVLLHDAPILVSDAFRDDEPPSDAFTVVAPLSWAADEPVEQVIDAAARCPSVHVVATGRPPQAVAGRADLPPNLELAGYLDDDAFARLMAGAGVVLALTTREATMQRAGYEAMAIGRPVIASDTPVLREFFGDAALYARSTDELVEAIGETRARREDLAVAMRARREHATREFERGVAEVRAAMGVGERATP
jgi:glycosyltransferase involved in cell wall biosynthesis